MDRCKCWVNTQVTIYIQHCPSETAEIAKEVDRISQFAMTQTSLNRFGKARIGTTVTNAAQTDGE